jgi:hypothetical protein
MPLATMLLWLELVAAASATVPLNKDDVVLPHAGAGRAPLPRPDQTVVGLPLPWLRSVRAGVLSLPRPKWLAPRWCGGGRCSETDHVGLLGEELNGRIAFSRQI